MKKSLVSTSIFLITLLSACGTTTNSTIYPVVDQNVDAYSSASKDLTANTVISSGFAQDHNGDHYGYDQYSITYEGQNNTTESINIAHNQQNTSGWINLAHNSSSNSPTVDSIELTDLTKINKVVSTIENLKFNNATDKSNVGKILNYLKSLKSSPVKNSISSKVPANTVINSGFSQDHNGDHYGFDQYELNYESNSNTIENIHIVHNKQVVNSTAFVGYVTITHNPDSSSPTQDSINLKNLTDKNQLNKLIATMSALRTNNSTDQSNLSGAVNYLATFR